MSNIILKLDGKTIPTRVMNYSNSDEISSTRSFRETDETSFSYIMSQSVEIPFGGSFSIEEKDPSTKSEALRMIFITSEAVDNIDKILNEEIEVEDVLVLKDEISSSPAKSISKDDLFTHADLDFESTDDFDFKALFDELQSEEGLPVESIKLSDDQSFANKLEIDLSQVSEINSLEDLGITTPRNTSSYHTYVEVEYKKLDNYVKEFGSRYIIKKFRMDRAKKALDTPELIVEEDFYNNDGKVMVNTISKKIWKNSCWRKYLKNQKDKIDPAHTNGKRILILLQGTFERKTGFFQLLNNPWTLSRLSKIYGDRIFLCNYPTLFRGIEHNAETLMRMFEKCGFRNSEVDMIATSRGSLVARQLMVGYGEESSFIKRFISINAPNLGTPLASHSLNLLKLFGSFIGYREAYLDLILKALVKKSIKAIKGISDMEPKNNSFLNTLNTSYNLLDTRNHYYLGTEKNIGGHVLFGGEPNDRVIPVSSMIGENKGSYGYSGPELKILTKKFIVQKRFYGQRHGRQFKNIQILEGILNILKGNLV